MFIVGVVLEGLSHIFYPHCLTVRVTVNNNNSSVCLQNQYNLSGLLPGGWSTSFSPSVLNLNSGQQGTSTWSVTSSSIAVASSYQITAQAVDAVNSTYTDSENATYVVFIDTTP